MKPVDFLSRVEPVMRSLFEAVRQANVAGDSERKYLAPQFQHHASEVERRSSLEDYDEHRLVYLHARAAEAHEALTLIDTAAAAAAGAILQTAKQCIAMAWRRDVRLSKGRFVGSQHLSAVIWFARNQAQHFDEGPPSNRQTRDGLEKLAAEVELDLSGLSHTPRSLAGDVIRILGWQNYELFAKDMTDLLQEP